MSKETRRPHENVSSPERKPGWSRRVRIESSSSPRTSPALPPAIHLGGKAGEARETRSFKIEGGEQVQVRGGGILYLSPTWRSWAWATERSTRVHRVKEKEGNLKWKSYLLSRAWTSERSTYLKRHVFTGVIDLKTRGAPPRKVTWPVVNPW